MKLCFAGPLRLLMMINKMLHVKRILICDFTENCVHTKLAILATEECQEFQHWLFAFRNKGLLKCSLIPRHGRGLCEHFTYPKGQEFEMFFITQKIKGHLC